MKINHLLQFFALHNEDAGTTVTFVSKHGSTAGPLHWPVSLARIIELWFLGKYLMQRSQYVVDILRGTVLCKENEQKNDHV